jgi:eukaryotic-like serine/threonine-protein kinase
VEYGAALALAFSGDFPQAQTLADDLEKRFPEDTCVRFSYLPVLRAQLAGSHSDPSKAVEVLQAAVPNELGAQRSTIHALFGALYPIYVRGEAYISQGRASEGALEFQKILRHPGIVASDPIGALAHLQLGRAYALLGDKTKAIRLSGLSYALERCGPRHFHSGASQSRIRQTAVNATQRSAASTHFDG